MKSNILTFFDHETNQKRENPSLNSLTFAASKEKQVYQEAHVLHEIGDFRDDSTMLMGTL